MHIEQFATGTTVLHRLDPRSKIISASLFALVCALADRWPVLLAALAASLILVALGRLDIKIVLVRLAIVNTFVFFLWVFLPFSQGGREVFHLGPLTAGTDGIYLALAITIKSNAIILAIMALLGTSTFNSLVHALRHLKMPDKLVHLFFFTFRYFQVIHQEYTRLRAAMKVRCFRPGNNLHTYRSMAYLVGMLLVKSSDRAERVHQAMLCRGYQGKLWVLDHFHMQTGPTRFF